MAQGGQQGTAGPQVTFHFPEPKSILSMSNCSYNVTVHNNFGMTNVVNSVKDEAKPPFQPEYVGKAIGNSASTKLEAFPGFDQNQCIPMSSFIQKMEESKNVLDLRKRENSFDSAPGTNGIVKTPGSTQGGFVPLPGSQVVGFESATTNFGFPPLWEKHERTPTKTTKPEFFNNMNGASPKFIKSSGNFMTNGSNGFMQNYSSKEHFTSNDSNNNLIDGMTVSQEFFHQMEPFGKSGQQITPNVNNSNGDRINHQMSPVSSFSSITPTSDLGGNSADTPQFDLDQAQPFDDTENLSPTKDITFSAETLKQAMDIYHDLDNEFDMVPLDDLKPRILSGALVETDSEDHSDTSVEDSAGISQSSKEKQGSVNNTKAAPIGGKTSALLGRI